MVGEFPELQGLIGGYLAAAQGEHPQVAAAIRDHYKPVGQGDEVPTDPVTVAVSLADKLDSIAGFFAIHERPTGSKDPFALRRAALGVIEIALKAGLRMDLGHVTAVAAGGYTRQWIAPGAGDEDIALHRERWSADLFRAVPEFFVDRLKVQQRSAGIRHDLIDAIYSLDSRSDDIVENLARVRSLQAFVETPEGADLLAGYKRAANILKKEGWPASSSPLVGEDQGGGPAASAAEESLPAADAAGPHPNPSPQGGGTPIPLSYTPEPAEAALIAALDSAEPEAAAAVEREDFEAAMRALATLRGPVDAFFTEVIVNDPDQHKRAARLDLLARMRDAVHRVADFSRIEG
jgi:glycyl-tRNA synthetase beta chain